MPTTMDVGVNICYQTMIIFKLYNDSQMFPEDP